MPLFKKNPVYRSLPVQGPGNSLNNHLFKKAKHDAYSDPGTRLGVQNKDFGTASYRRT